MYELWRDIAAFRQQFTELKGITERDLTRVKNDLAQTSRSLTSACLGFLTLETQGQVNRLSSNKYFFVFFSKRLRPNVNVVIVQLSKIKFGKKHEKLLIYNKSKSLFYYLILKPTFFVVKSRSQELSQLNEKLRLQLAEKEGTIVTLTRVNQTKVS
jgi:hypothetical protein